MVKARKYGNSPSLIYLTSVADRGEDVEGDKLCLMILLIFRVLWDFDADLISKLGKNVPAGSIEKFLCSEAKPTAKKLEIL